MRVTRVVRMYNGVLMARRWLLLAVLISLTTQVSAQRVFKTIKPDEVDETLKFDVNSVPVKSTFFSNTVASTTVETPRRTSSGQVLDLNFCPNVVFSPDSTKGFVSFPGSDKVMVFDPKTGDILSILEVGMNPGQLSISPDGKTVMTLCLLLARNIPKGQGQNFNAEEVATLVAIDVETLEVRTLDLTQVWFSLFNNIVFSPDSQTAFVASMRTDELLRFDVGSLTEIQPRLKFRTGGWPAALTMASDYSFMTAVLTNSTAVNRLTNPDAIAFIDPAQFKITRTLSPPTDAQANDQDFRYPQDFTAMNTVALSPDGKFGAIGDLAYSSQISLPDASRDRVWIFNVETGDFQLYLAFGPATSVFATPDGRFLVPGSLYFTFIDPVAKTSGEVAPLFTHSGFLPRTKPAFSADGTRMYFATPYYDTLDVFNLVTNEFPVSVSIGGPIELSDGEILTSAPLQLQFTPDHEVLAAVNFNANTIDLIEHTAHVPVAGLRSNDTFFTGLALTNPSADDANLVVTGYRNDGQLFADDTSTEDVVEFVNPQTMTVPAGSQLAETAEEILSSAPDQTIAGWIDIDTDQPDLKSFSLIGDRVLKRLDGVVASSPNSVQFIVPEVRVADGFATELVVLNPNLQTVHLVAQLFNNSGELLATRAADISRRSSLVEFLRDPDPEDTVTAGMFAESYFEDFEDGYVVLTTATRVVAFERYYDTERMSALDCASIVGEDPTPTRFVLPQIVEFEGNQTTLKLVNSHPIPPEPAEGEDPVDPETLKLNVQLSLKGSDGQDLAAPVIVDLEAGQSIRRDVAELFGLEDSGEVVSGWILVDVNQAGLVGSAEFQVYGGKGMSTVPLQVVSENSSQMVFSHVAQGQGLSTGLVLVNPGTESANVTVQVFRKEGDLNAGTVLQVPAGGRIAGLLPELIDGLADQIGGYVKVDSDSGLIGLELFYANSLEYIAAVEAQ